MIEAPFESMKPECNATVTATTFRYQGKIYTISTTSLADWLMMQKMFDMQAGYTGLLGNYETMLFINGSSDIYPFGDLPGHQRLGVFQRYTTEDEARDGHQAFVTRVQRILLGGSTPALT